MSITNNETRSAQTQTAQIGRPVQQQTQAQPEMQQPKRWSFHEGFGLSAPIGKNMGSEALTKLQKALVEVFKGVSSEYRVSLIPMDNNNDRSLAFSTMLVAMQRVGAEDLGVAFMPLILEGSGEKIPPRFETINGAQVEILRPTSDAADMVLSQKVNQQIAAAFPNVRSYACLPIVVPASFNVEDAVAVHKLAVVSGLACHTELMQRQSSFQDINLAQREADSTLVIRHDYERRQETNEVGMPVRSDVRVQFQSQQNQNNQNNRSVNDGGRIQKVASVSGYLDFIYAPVRDRTNPMLMANSAMAQMQPDFYQTFVAQYVMTNIECEQLNTLPSLLLAIATAFTISADNGWYASFKSRTLGRNETDLYDVGALNVEANTENNPNGIGGIIDTKIGTFTNERLVQFLNMVVRPGLLMSVDCPEFGPSSWFLNDLAAAASIGDGSQQAREASMHARQHLFDAANTLTNGIFSRYFNQNNQMFLGNGVLVHTGFYEDSNGVKRDIRDIDYLAVVNSLSNDPDVIRKWTDTFVAQNIDPRFLLAERKRIISGIVPRAEFTGFARRVSFSNEFVQALVKGCAEAGLVSRIDQNQLFGQGVERATGSFLASGLVSGLGNNMFGGTTGGSFAGGFVGNNNGAFWR